MYVKVFKIFFSVHTRLKFVGFNMIMMKCFFLILCIGFFLGHDCVEPEKKKAEMKKYLKRVKKKEGKIILTNGNEHYEG